MKGVKVGVYIEEELYRQLEELKKRLGVKSTSRLVREAVRAFVAERSLEPAGNVVAVIGLVYNHEVGEADEELTDIQHEFMDVIVSAVHIHLDRERCLLAIFARGNGARVASLFERLERVRGVLGARILPLAGGPA